MTIKGVGRNPIEQSSTEATSLHASEAPRPFGERLASGVTLSPTEQVAAQIAAQIEGGELTSVEGVRALVETMVEAHTKHLSPAEREHLRELLVDDPTIQIAASAMLLEAVPR